MLQGAEKGNQNRSVENMMTKLGQFRGTKIPQNTQKKTLKKKKTLTDSTLRIYLLTI